MKRPTVVLLCVVGLVCAYPAAATPPTYLWGKTFGDAQDQQSAAVAIDATGSVYIAGHFKGTVNFGGSNLVSVGSDYDAFLAKFDVTGVHQWSKKFGDASAIAGFQYGRSLAVDADGNVILAGDFTGSIDLEPFDLFGHGGYDVFIAKFTPSGTALWSQNFGYSGNQTCRSIATDAAGNVILTGEFDGVANFGGANLTSAGWSDIYVAKLNPAGAHQWSQRFGDTLVDGGAGVATDAEGNVCITGNFQGTVNFGSGNMTSDGNADMFLAKFNGAGVCQWSQRFGSISETESYSLATDAPGNLFMTGRFLGPLDLGGGYLYESGGGLGDIFLAKFDATGAHQWSQRFGGGLIDVGIAVATDATGDVHLAGKCSGSTNFGGIVVAPPGGFGGFFAKFTSAGAAVWAREIRSTSFERDIATSQVGDVYLTGAFAGTMDLGGGPVTSAGGDDAYLARFSPLPAGPTIESITDVGNDEGRQVLIAFSRSAYDAEVSLPAVRYEVFRRQDLFDSAIPANVNAPARLALPGWVYTGSVPAVGNESYIVSAPTLADSTIAAGQHYSVFFIRAATATPVVFYDSPVDSGYSVDNLAPGAPTSLTYAGEALQWDESDAQDFDFFTVYGANSSCFCAATVVDYTVAPTLDVSGSPYVHYFVTATDFSGNESQPTMVDVLTGTGGSPLNYVLSIFSYPNPFNPVTTVRYTVPSRGPVDVSIYDARGSLVATLVDGVKSAGSYTQRWSGNDDAGRVVSSGVYFARVRHASGTRTYKMVLLK